MALVRDNTEIALESLFSRKFRTSLSVLGIIIGVAAVIIIGSISISGKKIIFDELTTFGLKSVWIWTNYDEEMGKDRTLGSGIVAGDAKAILKACKSVKRITPIISRQGIPARYGNRNMHIKLYCVNEDYTTINNDEISLGRPLLLNDIRYKSRVCLIGDEIYSRLFSKHHPLGQTLKVGNQWFTVVGVLKRKDRSFINAIADSDRDSVNGRVVIPISIYQQHYNTREVESLQVEAFTVSLAKTAAEEAVGVLERRHNNRFRYKFEAMQQYIEITQKVMRTVSWVGSVAAVISLIVGGIGIMNIMTATVVERTREIGIRKALGASQKDILWQFLMESIWISLFGGIVGTLTGIVTIIAIEITSGNPVTLASQFIFFALVVSLSVGLFFGIYPAMRAAAMDPVDALRVE